MKEIVLITGANGFIAQHVASILSRQYDIRFLSRNPKHPNEYRWDLTEKYIDEKALEGVDYIIHLAGYRLYDGEPVTPERQELARNTRIEGSKLLFETVKKQSIKLKAFISASAMGYYGFTDDKQAIDETSEKGTGFIAEWVSEWEKQADLFKEEGLAGRIVKHRICMVLGKDDVTFLSLKKEMEDNPEAAKSTEDKTYLPWAHVEDIAGMFAFAVTNKTLNGAFNTTAPEVTTREAFLKKMYYFRRKEMDACKNVDLSYDGKYITSEKIVNAGFVFKYPNIDSALENLMV